MRWLRADNKRAKPAGARTPAVVVAVTTPLNRETALELRRQVELLDPHGEVVIDLTAIPAFDSDGADALLEIQAAQGERRVSIVGLRQATARLIGADESPSAAPDHQQVAPPAAVDQATGWAARRLRNLLVVQPADASLASATGLEDTITQALADLDAAIIVLDLRGVMDLPATAVEAIAFASSTAALRGQELLVVNVQADGVEALRAAGLSATTFVAPEPFDTPPFDDGQVHPSTSLASGQIRP